MSSSMLIMVSSHFPFDCPKCCQKSTENFFSFIFAFGDDRSEDWAVRNGGNNQTDEDRYIIICDNEKMNTTAKLMLKC